MAVELGDALVRIEAHRLDEVEALGRRHKFSLRQAFAPFVGGDAVGHDPRTQAEPREGLAVLQDQGPDRDIERGFAVRRKPADTTGIGAPLFPLELGDDLHRPDLRARR